MTVINPSSISGITSITLPSGDGNVLTIHTNDGTERFRIDSSGNVKVGSAATISPDGDVFFTGVTTATTFTGAHSGSGANLTSLPSAQLTGALPAISGANLTGIAATDNVRTGILDVAGIATFRNDVKIGAAVTISESGIEATGVGITVANINGGGLSNRNLLINSAFEIWQRGTTAASGASGGNRYLADRWSVPNRTRMAQSTDVPAGFKYAILLDREQTGGSEPFTIHQGIEKDNIRKTGSYTLSFYAKSSDISSVNINVQDRTTVAEGGTNHSSIVTNQAVTITSSWARYTYTFTLSSIALTGDCLRISIGNTSADQHDELLLTGIQLETGSVATAFEHRSFGDELVLCQRYFEKTYAQEVALGNASNFSGAYSARDGTASSVARYYPFNYKITKLSLIHISEPTRPY